MYIFCFVFVCFYIIDNDNFSDDNNDDKLPTPAKPSLKMRLFCDEKKRELLRSVFEKTDNSSGSDDHSGASLNREKWLSTSENGAKKGKRLKENKRPDVIAIDDSF